MARTPIPRIFRLFKHRGHKQFQMHTRYYDADKEARESRTARYKQEQGMEQTEEEERFNMERRISFRDKAGNKSGRFHRSQYQAQTQKANRRLLVIISMLGVLTWAIFKYLNSQGFASFF